MKIKHNVMSCFEYCAFSSALAVLSCVLYKMILFIPIASLSYNTSEKIWGILCAVSFILSTLYFINSERNGLSMFITMVMPNGFFTLISYFEIFHLLCLSTCAAIFIVLCVQTIKFGRLHARIVFQSISAVLFSLILIIIFYLTIQDGFMKAHPQKPTSRIMIADRMDQLVKFKPDTWECLSIEERLECLQSVADIETSDLGLSTPLQVTVDRFESKNTLAAYENKSQRTSLSIDHIRNSPPKDVLCSVLHEAYHAYQQDQISIYFALPDNLKRSKLLEDARRYIRDDDPFIHYEDRSQEQDAYHYSHEKCDVYWSLIFLQ